MKHKGLLIVAGAVVVLAGVVGWSVLLFLIFRGGLLYPHNKPANPADFTVRFGILEVDSNRQPFLAKETTTIPMKLKDTGFEYGIMIVPPDNRYYTYRMVLHFSGVPKVISGNGFDSNVPSSTMQTPLVVMRGTTYEEYGFDEGDPMGQESIDVYINGKLARTIRYTVVAPDAGAAGN